MNNSVYKNVRRISKVYLVFQVSKDKIFWQFEFRNFEFEYR